MFTRGGHLTSWHRMNPFLIEEDTTIACQHVLLMSVLCLYDFKSQVHLMKPWVVMECVELKHSNFNHYCIDASTLKAKPTLVICKTCFEGWFVPQNPTTQCTRRGWIIPVFTHPPMTFQVPSSTSYILVLRKVRVSFLSERLNDLPSVGFDKHCIELLFSDMALTNGFEP